MNILIKLMSIVSLVIAPHIYVGDANSHIGSYSDEVVQISAGDVYAFEGANAADIQFMGPETSMTGPVAGEAFKFDYASEEHMINLALKLNIKDVGGVLNKVLKTAEVHAEELVLGEKGLFQGNGYVVLDGNAMPAKLSVTIVNEKKISVSLKMI
ncbi:MAG: hypothetical protein ACJAZH_001083 [Roseivirga sp.]|jgi:hypothetical protein